MGKLWPLGMCFMSELQTVKMCSDYFKKFYRSMANFMPFHVKIPQNPGPRSDSVISDFAL